jgi:hypothetical protein
MYLTEDIMIVSLIIAAMYFPLIYFKEKIRDFFWPNKLHKRRIESNHD